MCSKEKGLLWYEIFFLIMVTTHKKPKNETHNLKNKKKKGGNCGGKVPPNKNWQKHEGKEPMEAQRYKKTKDKMATGNSHTLIITLNVNGLNLPIKRQGQRLDQKTKLNHMLPSGDITTLQKTKTDSKWKGENDFLSK